MTRSERIRKLGNAIKEYRGRFHSVSGKWIHGPRPSARVRCIRWLQELKLDVAEIKVIDGFKSMAEFDAWIGNLK